MAMLTKGGTKGEGEEKRKMNGRRNKEGKMMRMTIKEVQYKEKKNTNKKIIRSSKI
jgi:hypothetical protein